MVDNKCSDCWRLQIKIADQNAKICNSATELLKLIYTDDTFTKVQKEKLSEIHKILRK
jgi:hypothetical protein